MKRSGHKVAVGTRRKPWRSLAADELSAVPAGHRRMWRIVTAAEVAAGCVAVAADLLLPTLILLALAVVSLVIRRAGLPSLGFHRAAPIALAVRMLVFAGAWSVFQLAVSMPIANHVSGKKADLGDYADLQGNIGTLLGLLLVTWTLAAVGEELAYRGYLQTRMRELFGSGRIGLVVAVAVSSVLFGVAHSEQGLVGAVTITLDAVAFSVLRYRYHTLWASVLAHGLNNTIGFVAFFFVGPIYGFW